MSTATANTQSILNDIENIVNRFKNVLDAETTALKKSDLEAFKQHSEEKIELAREYQTLLEDIQIKRRNTPDLTSTEKEKLAEISAVFKKVLRDNANALKSSKKAVERVVKRITAVACEAASEKKQTYTAYGKLEAKSTRPISTLIDQA